MRIVDHDQVIVTSHFFRSIVYMLGICSAVTGSKFLWRDPPTQWVTFLTLKLSPPLFLLWRLSGYVIAPTSYSLPDRLNIILPLMIFLFDFRYFKGAQGILKQVLWVSVSNKNYYKFDFITYTTHTQTTIPSYNAWTPWTTIPREFNLSNSSRQSNRWGFWLFSCGTSSPMRTKTWDQPSNQAKSKASCNTSS